MSSEDDDVRNRSFINVQNRNGRIGGKEKISNAHKPNPTIDYHFYPSRRSYRATIKESADVQG